MITHYDILRGSVGNGFEQRVQERINVGWQPYGSPHYRTEKLDLVNINTLACQAMVKYSQPNAGPQQIPVDPRPSGA